MNPVEILLYSEVYSDSAEAFIKQISAAGDSPIHLRINSPGGNVFAGTAIYNALLSHKGGVTVTVDGLAASIASLIMLAGKPVRISANAMVMIHNPSGGAYGEAGDMRKTADVLDKIQGALVDAYMHRIGDKVTREEVVAMLDAETWLSAEDAVKLGLADQVIKPEREASAKFDLSKFKRVPFDIIARINAGKPQTKFQNMTPEELAALNEKIAAIEARLQALEDAATAAKADAEAAAALAAEEAVKAQAALAENKATAAQFTAKVTDLAAKLTAKDAEFAALKTSHEAMITKIKALGTQEANEILASFGQRITTPAAVVKPTAPNPTADILAQFDAIKDAAERHAFFNKHAAALRAARK